MSIPVKLAGFALVLLATFGASFGIGRAVGPVGDDSAPAPTRTATTTTMVKDHGGHS